MHLRFLPRRALILLWLCFPIFLLLYQLDYAPFWNPDEGRYSAASLEMAFGLGGGAPDWLVPHLNTLTRLNKPPLVYWLAAGSFSLWGPSEWSGRLVPALAAIAVLLVLFQWARVIFGVRAGLGAALVWATMILPFALARTLNTDMLLCAAVTLALWGLCGPWKNRAGALGVAGLGLGLALLAKGPVGILMPLGIAGVAALAGRSGPAFWRPASAALALGVAVGVPWYLLVQIRQPDFLQTFLFSENLSRFSGSGSFHEKKPIWFYLPVLIVALFPWTPFLAGALRRPQPHKSAPLFESNGVRETTKTPFSDGKNQTRVWRLWWIWAVLVVGVFSLSSTKLISYILPAMPAFALVLGTAISQWQNWPRAARVVGIGIAVFLQLAIAAALFVLPVRDHQTRSWTAGPGVLRNESLLSREQAAPFLWPLGAVLIGGSLGLLAAARRGAGIAVLGVQGLTAGAFFAVVVPLAGRVARYEDASEVFIKLRPILRPQDQIVNFRSFTPSGIFYAARPLIQFDFSNSSGLPPHEVQASPWFLESDSPDLKRVLESRGRVFWITRHKAPPELAQLRFWGRNNDFFLYSNREKPPEFRFDSVAPRKRHR